MRGVVGGGRRWRGGCWVDRDGSVGHGREEGGGGRIEWWERGVGVVIMILCDV